MNIKINIVEMSCYFADDIKIDNGEGGYTEEAQDLFNELYDEYYNEFEQFKITN